MGRYSNASDPERRHISLPLCVPNTLDKREVTFNQKKGRGKENGIEKKTDSEWP